MPPGGGLCFRRSRFALGGGVARSVASLAASTLFSDFAPSLSPLFSGLRESLIYHPLPLNTMPTGRTVRFTAPEHLGRRRREHRTFSERTSNYPDTGYTGIHTLARFLPHSSKSSEYYSETQAGKATLP
jgi:hypothetical protein